MKKIFLDNISNKVKYLMIEDNINYIEELINKLKEQQRLLNFYLDDLEIIEDEFSTPLDYLTNGEGAEMLLNLIREKLNIKDD